MAFTHGKNLAFSIDDSGGSLTDITAYVESVDFPESTDTAEVSTASNDSKAYVVGQSGANITVNMSFDPTCDAILTGIKGLTGSFEYGPAGTTVGNPKRSGECILTSYNVTSGVGGGVKASASFIVTGDVTYGTY